MIGQTIKFGKFRANLQISRKFAGFGKNGRRHRIRREKLYLDLKFRPDRANYHIWQILQILRKFADFANLQQNLHFLLTLSNPARKIDIVT